MSTGNYHALNVGKFIVLGITVMIVVSLGIAAMEFFQRFTATFSHILP